MKLQLKLTAKQRHLIVCGVKVALVGAFSWVAWVVVMTGIPTVLWAVATGQPLPELKAFIWQGTLNFTTLNAAGLALIAPSLVDEFLDWRQYRLWHKP